MEKEKLISKLNIKDYNNQLEKILSKKTFSEDAKNLLLSMLYKIENAYDDYSTVNGDTQTKRETLEEILETISEECDTIELTKEKKRKVIPEEKKIITYLNENAILYDIYKLSACKFQVPEKYEIIKTALEETLNQGYCISSSEIIRDFDGWSWNIEIDEIENLKANLVYQTLKILVGNDFLNNWRKTSKQDFVIKLQETLGDKYKTQLGEALFKTINQLSMLNVAFTDEQERKRLIEIQDRLEQEFHKLDNKQEYLDMLKNDKKDIAAKIKEIDTALNDDIKLKKEFIAKNELLDMNHRIFSLSDFAEILEKERKTLINEMDIINTKMEPLNFIRTKTEIEDKLKLIKELNLQNLSNETYTLKVQEMLKLVFQAMGIKIEMATEKKDIIKLIYQIRYYGLIYVEKSKQIQDIIDIKNVQKKIITKACKKRIITIFSRNIQQNYAIIESILKTDIIELEKMYFKFVKQNDKIVLNIYDEENLSKTIEFEKIEELNVKLDKKVKVFI